VLRGEEVEKQAIASGINLGSTCFSGNNNLQERTTKMDNPKL
jgi:hypothetical protein